MDTLWNKGMEAAQAVEDFTVGNDRTLDLQLAGYDVIGSKAHEDLCRLECRDVMCRNSHSLILGDVASRLLCAALYDEAAEAAEIDVFTFGKGVLDDFHVLFNDGLNLASFQTRSLSYFVHDFCFSHNELNLLVLLNIFFDWTAKIDLIL